MTKDELIKAREFILLVYNNTRDNFCNKQLHLENTLKALDAQIRACDVPKIEGLGEALDKFLDVKFKVENNLCASDSQRYLLSVTCNKYMGEILKAARAYHKLTGGE